MLLHLVTRSGQWRDTPLTSVTSDQSLIISDQRPTTAPFLSFPFFCSIVSNQLNLFLFSILNIACAQDQAVSFIS